LHIIETTVSIPTKFAQW